MFEWIEVWHNTAAGIPASTARSARFEPSRQPNRRHDHYTVRRTESGSYLVGRHRCRPDRSILLDVGPTLTRPLSNYPIDGLAQFF